jgi:hypothetical protein
MEESTSPFCSGAAPGRAAWVLPRVRKPHGFIVGQAIQEMIVTRDQRLRVFFGALA